jgi:hypothetical protein
VFLLGIITGVLTGLQQTGVMSSKGGNGERSDTAMADHNQDIKLRNGATSKKDASKVKGATTTLDGLKVAADVRLSTACGSSTPKRAGLSSSGISQLKKLAEYEEVCGNAFANRISFFVGMAKDTAGAKEEADWVAGVLKEISSKGLSPIVFMEPAVNGETINFASFKGGTYDAALDAYFAALKANGITDAMMGTWVPFPESNIPVWNNTNPGDFSANVTKTVQAQKKHFPGSKAAVLLQTMTYADASWEKGAYVSLKPYVQGIPKGLVDSFGMQGFPWPPTDPTDTAQLDPKKFLRTDFAKEAADVLGAKEVWFNTGTFAKSLLLAKPYTLTPQQRQAILDSILGQAKVLKGQGFSVAVHMFNEDKSGTDEKIDWSYWAKGKAGESLHTPVFKTFVSDAAGAGIPIWIFDSSN